MRRLLDLRDIVSKYRTLLLWVLWVGAGAVWGALAEGWDPITAVYFAVGGLGTGGLQAPPHTAPHGQGCAEVRGQGPGARDQGLGVRGQG